MSLTIRQRWANLLGRLADHPNGSALAATLLLILCAALIRPPEVEGALVEQMSGSNEQLETARRISAAAGNKTSIVLVLTPRQVSIVDIKNDLFGLGALIDDIAGRPRVDIWSINQAPEHQFVYDLGDDDSVQRYMSVLNEYPGTATIISDDAQRFLAVVTVAESFAGGALAALRGHDWERLYEDVVFLASAQLEQDVAAGLRRDLLVLIPTIVALTLVALFGAFGHWRALLLPLFASTASTVVTMALFSAAVVSINLVTLIALPVVLIVGLANSCHFLAKSDAGTEDDVNLVVRKTMQRVGPPFFFSTLTTAIALASLGFNELRPIANLGLLSAAALLVVFVLVLLAAPQSLRWYLSRPGRSLQVSRPYIRLSRWLRRRRTHISALLLLAMLGGAVTAPLLTVQSDPRSFIPDDAPFSSALTMFEKEFFVFSPLRALMRVPEDDLLAGLQRASELREELSRHPGTLSVRLQPAINNANNEWVFTALLARRDDLAVVRELLDSAANDDVELVYSSATLVYGDIDRQATESLLRSLGWSVALIFGAILVLFRSARALFSALLASAVPLMIVCGTVWVIGNPLNLVTVFVFLVALGIIVDDSIHILFWRASGDSVSGSSIEFSVLLSTFILCLGLLLCQLSDFPTTRLFAAYCALALVAAVISNLTVLPQLLQDERR